MNRQKKEIVAKYVFFAFALSSILAVALISIFIFAGGAPAIKEIGLFKFLFGSVWRPSDVPPSYGILSMIIGSVLVTIIAILVGVPIGVFTSVFLSYFCPDPLHKIVDPAVNLLAGIPSVIYGFFGIVVIIPIIRNTFGGDGDSILAAGVLLGIMILPTIVSISQAAIRAVPRSYYEGALALGATKEQAVFKTILPAAKSGVLAAIILGVGRSIGETMAVQMVAGNQPRITFNVIKGIRTMTANIVLEMAEATDLHRSALIATGAVLFFFILIINGAFALVKRRLSDEK